MEEYKPNSYRAKEAAQGDAASEKKVDKVVAGTVRTKKRSELSKWSDVFLSKDVASVKDYIFGDVLVPAVKKAVSDIVTNGIDMLLYGESGKRRSGVGASRVSYGSYYDRSRDYDEAPMLRAKSSYSYDDITFETRGDAEQVLMRMDELLDQYRVVSVSDLYDLAGISDTVGNYTDTKYGWIDLRTASVVRVPSGGYMLRLPRAMPLN